MIFTHKEFIFMNRFTHKVIDSFETSYITMKEKFVL